MYAPKWLRDGAERPRKIVAMRLPEAMRMPDAPQLGMPAPPSRAEHPVADLDGEVPPDLGVRPDPDWPREPFHAGGIGEGPLPSFLERGHDGAEFAGDRDIRRLWQHQTLAPTQVPEPPEGGRMTGELSMAVLLRFGGAIAAAALAAMVVVGAFAMPDIGSRNPAAAARPAAPVAVKEAARGDEAWPGTPAERVVSAVQQAAYAPAKVQTVTIAARPPEPAQPAETERAAAPPPQPAAAAVETPPPTPAIEADELARMVKRGEDFIGQGDFAAARLILQRAAGAGDARAALLLGATYDPGVLRQLHVMGFKPDIGAARSWYQKAAQAGSAEATRRLTVLANLGD